MKIPTLFLSFSITLFSVTFAQSTTHDKIKQDIKHNTKVVSKKAAKNVEYVAKESGKNIKKNFRKNSCRSGKNG